MDKKIETLREVFGDAEWLSDLAYLVADGRSPIQYVSELVGPILAERAHATRAGRQAAADDAVWSHDAARRQTEEAEHARRFKLNGRFKWAVSGLASRVRARTGGYQLRELREALAAAAAVDVDQAGLIAAVEERVGRGQCDDGLAALKAGFEQLTARGNATVGV